MQASGFLQPVKCSISYHERTKPGIFGKDTWITNIPVTANFAGYPRVEVPAGYVTDGASVPRLFWRLFPKLSDYTNCAVIHDFLCEHGKAGTLHKFEGLKGVSSKDAHNLFLQCMLFAKVGPKRAKLMHRAVLWFGPRWS